ncbi:MAG: hypothetical protein KKH21_14765 [Gammaproteobacteria bacterium]|jgi:hypothetical protein|nr:hypothetical protein [Gammaproteobacteria bacterium]MBU0828531.1 hypothetical protein [Gammaproteobacteria bacterium]MBU0892125.1 hypothetical protein [Gammaproteobacteria bacterium]MBU1818265.1 hypothetical protein [Gammaproteobacteria bacterium]
MLASFKKMGSGGHNDHPSQPQWPIGWDFIKEPQFRLSDKCDTVSAEALLRVVANAAKRKSKNKKPALFRVRVCV